MPGVSIGLAAQGFRPVAEIQFTGFAYACIDQMLNHASRLRSAHARAADLSDGAALARRRRDSAPSSTTRKAPRPCSRTFPGLKVVMPSSPARAYGLLLSAIRDPDPVMFLEPTRLYRAAREDVSDDGADMPLGTVFRAAFGRATSRSSPGAR